MTSSAIRPLVYDADVEHVRMVTDLWAPAAIYYRAKDPKWSYSFFAWDKILVHFPSWAAMLKGRLEGLIAYGEVGPSLLKVHFLASAPWNVPPSRRLSGVGTGLLAHAVRAALARRVDLCLSSTPDSERFYEARMGLARTGESDDEGLAIFRLAVDAMPEFLNRFPPLEDGQ